MQGQLLRRTAGPVQGQSATVGLPSPTAPGRGRKCSVTGVRDREGVAPTGLVDPGPRQRGGRGRRVLGDRLPDQRPTVARPQQRAHLQGADEIFGPDVVDKKVVTGALAEQDVVVTGVAPFAIRRQHGRGKAVGHGPALAIEVGAGQVGRAADAHIVTFIHVVGNEEIIITITPNHGGTLDAGPRPAGLSPRSQLVSAGPGTFPGGSV